MKRKSNYIPYDDIEGQTCLDGCEITVRVKPPEPVKAVKPIEQASGKISTFEYYDLRRQYIEERREFFRKSYAINRNAIPVNAASLCDNIESLKKLIDKDRKINLKGIEIDD